jgi:hypothetical protein
MNQCSLPANGWWPRSFIDAEQFTPRPTEAGALMTTVATGRASMLLGERTRDLVGDTISGVTR